MPFAAPLNWPLTLLWSTWTLVSLMSLIWWIQLPTLFHLTTPPSQCSPIWNW